MKIELVVGPCVRVVKQIEKCQALADASLKPLQVLTFVCGCRGRERREE